MLSHSYSWDYVRDHPIDLYKIAAIAATTLQESRREMAPLAQGQQWLRLDEDWTWRSSAVTDQTPPGAHACDSRSRSSSEHVSTKERRHLPQPPLLVPRFCNDAACSFLPSCNSLLVINQSPHFFNANCRLLPSAQVHFQPQHFPRHVAFQSAAE